MGERHYYIKYAIFFPVLLSTCLTAPTNLPKVATTALEGGNQTSSGDDFTVPKSTIILFAVLGGLLVFMLLLYVILGFECCDCFRPVKGGKKKDETKPRPDSTQYTKLEKVKKLEPLFESDEEDEVKLVKGDPDEVSTHSIRTSGVETGSAQSLNTMWPQGDLALGDSASVYNQRQQDIVRPRTSTHINGTTAKPAQLGHNRPNNNYDAEPEPSDQVDSRYHINAGRVRVAISYSPSSDKLEVTIVRVEDIPEHIVRRERATMVEVHVALFPRKQRFKTRAKPDRNAIFNETFTIRRLSQEAVFNCLLRIRLYGRVKGKDNFLGEATYSLKDLDINDIDTNLWLTFAPRPGLLS